MAKAKSPIPEGYHTVTPQLTLDNAAQAIDWYKKALGAEEGTRAVGPDGKIMHAELRIGDSRIMVNDAMMGSKGPIAIGWLAGIDLALRARCRRAVQPRRGGGRPAAAGPMGSMGDQFWGDRCGNVTDPHGYTWTIATHKEDLSREEIEKRQAEWMKQFAPQPAHK